MRLVNLIVHGQDIQQVQKCANQDSTTLILNDITPNRGFRRGGGGGGGHK